MRRFETSCTKDDFPFDLLVNQTMSLASAIPVSAQSLRTLVYGIAFFDGLDHYSTCYALCSDENPSIKG